MFFTHSIIYFLTMFLCAVHLLQAYLAITKLQYFTGTF